MHHVSQDVKEGILYNYVEKGFLLVEEYQRVASTRVNHPIPIMSKYNMNLHFFYKTFFKNISLCPEPVMKLYILCEKFFFSNVVMSRLNSNFSNSSS